MIGKCYYLAAPDNVGLDQSETHTAIAELENFIEDFPLSPLIGEAEELLGKCRDQIAEKTYKNGEQYYKMGNHRSARVYLETVVTDYESNEWRGCALYLLASIDEKQEKYEDAATKLNNLLEAFPGHKWEKKARSKLEDVRLHLGDVPVVSDSL
jgi:outer membrane protein assembly factor BamD (BamD/ComL family)